MPVCKNEKGADYFNAAYLKPDDFATARCAWRRAICGDRETNDVHDPIIRQMMDIYDKNARNLRNKMNRGDGIPILFGDNEPVESGELCTQYNFLLQMAIAYGTFGCTSYHSTELLKDIIYGLDWMEKNMYGAEVLSDTSFRSYRFFNWWDWYIGGAVPMLETVMIIEESLTREEIDRYVLPMSFLRTQMRLGNNAEMAVGQIMPCTRLALLTDDKALLQSMYLAMGKLLEKHEDGDNMRADWCCMTHGMPYNLGYGQSNLDRVAFILQTLSATPLNFPLKDKMNLMEMVRYSFAPCLYHGRGLQMMDGRGMQTDNDADTALRLCSSLRFLFGVFGKSEDEEIISVIRRNATPHFLKGILGYNPNAVKPGEEPVLETMPSVGLPSYKIYKSILLSEKQQDNTYEIAYMWRSGDCCVQHHNGVCFGLRMNSERVFGYECINHQNTDGWYTGDGQLYMYLPGQDVQYSCSYWEKVDKYHIPSVTADTQKRESKSIVDCFAYYSDRDFTGGVTLHRQYLTAAMDFRSFHNEKVFVEEDIGYGAGLPLHTCTLEGHKAWFFFDKAVVALGAGIRANDGFEVHTTVENRIFKGNKSVFIDGHRLENEEYQYEYKNAHWICIDGICGYVFLQSADIVIRRQSVGDEDVFLTVWINHGVNPHDAEYAYALLPMADRHMTENCLQSCDLRILSLANGCLAATEQSTQLSGYAFFEPGEAGMIHAETPFIMMRDANTGCASVCDPTQKQGNVRFSVLPNREKIITVPTKDTHGKTVFMK